MPARPSRKPRVASPESAKAAGRVTSGNLKGEDLKGYPKQRRALADAKHRVGSARSR